jgi:putative transposase
MSDGNVVELRGPASEARDALTEVLREGAQRLLAGAVEAEADAFRAQHAQVRDEHGRRCVVRNGHLPEREVQTGVGQVSVKMPRARDNSGSGIRFTSKILPPYLRRTKSIEELLPWLYLKGVSTGDFSEALGALLGPNAPGLSPSTISRLKELWKEELTAWQSRDLSGRRFVYWWVDGVYLHARMEEAKQCILVVMGADETGKKHLVALVDGWRESEASWTELLLELRARGLQVGPELAVGDGALGFWKALPKVYGESKAQRCWVHKTANVLNKLPKGVQGKAKEALQAIWMAPCRAEAERAFHRFVTTHEGKYPKATECLAKDRAELLAFYDFPAEHWVHIRTTNPVESTLATVRLRTHKTRGCLSRVTAMTMVFKLVLSAQKRWRRLNASDYLKDVILGVEFRDGVRANAQAEQEDQADAA